MKGSRSIVVGMVLAVAVTGCEPHGVAVGIANGLRTVDAALFALEDARAAGLSVPIDTVIVREGNNLAAPAVRAADTIVSTSGLVAVIGHANSAASVTAAPIYNRAGVVQIAPHSTAEIYSEAGPYSFRLVPPDGQQGKVLARFLVEAFEGARVALAYVNDDYGRGLRAAVLASMPHGAVDVVVDVPHVEVTTPAKVRRTTMAIVDGAPDVILWLGRAQHLQRHLPTLRSELGQVPIVGGDALNAAEALPDPEGLFPPLHFVRLVDLDARPGTRRLQQRFRERYGREVTDAGALAYDALSLVLAAIEEGARSGDEVREYLHSLGRDRPPFPGITGPLRFDEKGDAARSYVMGRMLAHGGPSS